MKRILVTGGAGFIGSHLLERLLVEGHDVVCVDNFSTGHRQNIYHLKDHPGLDIMRHDVTSPLEIEVDAIYHLACPASPVQYQKNPVKTLETCFVGTLNVLRLAQRLNIPMLQASTSEVYGDPLHHPQTETYWGNVNPIGLRSCYDEGKRAAEALCFDYQRQYGVDVRVVRIFNTYGPRLSLDDGRVISNFIGNALQDTPVQIFGDGTQTRSFCYVRDLVDGLISTMRHPQRVETPMNLGNPDEISILTLAKTIVEKTQSRSPLVFSDTPSDDPKRRCPSIASAQKTIQWQPYTSLSDGLDRTIEYFTALIQTTQPTDELAWSI